MYKTLSLERREDHVIIVRMTREAEMNTLSVEFVAEFSAVLDQLRWAEDCRVLIITGQGRVFCAGDPLGDAQKLEPFSMRACIEKGSAMHDKLESMPQPTIAAINGYALGGGLELALACDFRIAIDKVKLGFPEVNLGGFPGLGGVVRLPRLIGLAKATELILLGRHLTGEEAEKCGLLYKSVPADQLMNETLSLAEELAKKSPVGIHLAKQCMQAAMNSDMQTANRLSLDGMSVCYCSQDTQEGVAAFFEKRPPVFPGFAGHIRNSPMIR